MNPKIGDPDSGPGVPDSDVPVLADGPVAAAEADMFGPSALPTQGLPVSGGSTPSASRAAGGGLFGPGARGLVGSVLDPDSGVFGIPGSYSSWEQFSEQAFADLDDLMNNDGEGAEEILFGPAGEAVDTAPEIFESVYQGRFEDQEAVGSIVSKSIFSQNALAPNFRGATSSVVTRESETNDDQKDSTANTGDDPLFSRQWYLHNTTSGVDINVSRAWDDFTGKGVKVAVCDDGIDYNHPDLKANYLHAMDYDAASATGDGKPRDTSDNHGTMVAGFIGAAKNGYGIVGDAYESGIASLRSGDQDQTAAVLEKAVDFDVCSNSWTFDPFDLTSSIDTSLKHIAQNGRGGLGTVTVFCASNEREYGIMSTYYTMENSPYTLTVGAVDNTGKYASFSCAGPNLLVTAPGVEVLSTDRTPSNGYESSGYFHTDSGTSFSTPMVSGVVALMLQANSGLGYRDVQSILAFTARKVDSMVSDDSKPWDWQMNSAHNWNGGGMHASHDYGFGLVDATAAVRLAESWDYGQHTYANQATQTASVAPGAAIPDNTGASVTSTATIGTDIIVQQAVVAVTLSHPRFDDLEMSLVSPNGTQSTLFHHPSYEGLAQLLSQGGTTVTAAELISGSTHTFGDTDTWLFNTVMPYGEHGQGDWAISVKDTVSGDTGTFASWSLTLYGDGVDNNDLYVFTNEYSSVAGDDATRKTITDTAGTDTINATAVTSDSSIDLTSGASSTIDGASMTIAAGTTIENVHTGDGNDSIKGNAANNSLFGWRGNDVISGQGGNDLLSGGTGKDVLTGGAGNDLFYYGAAGEGGDSIADFNHAEDGFNFAYANFGQSSSGSLAADHFFTSSASVNVSDACFIYESDSLWYDSDGTGTNASVELAQVHGEDVQVDDISFV